ncbi:MAG: hypothetical protein LBT01_03170 [Spirochaetaceae bacterium]|nr:hypothetical protein [Spirochaetaceae bacterium]
MAKKNHFASTLGFWMLCLRDTLFFIVVSVFPMAFILMASNWKGISWNELSGYLYGLVVPAVLTLFKNTRLTNLGLTIRMLKIVLFLMTFVMILFEKNNLVKTDAISFSILGAVFICMYYDIYTERKGR